MIHISSSELLFLHCHLSSTEWKSGEYSPALEHCLFICSFSWIEVSSLLGQIILQSLALQLLHPTAPTWQHYSSTCEGSICLSKHYTKFRDSPKWQPLYPCTAILVAYFHPATVNVRWTVFNRHQLFQKHRTNVFLPDLFNVMSLIISVFNSSQNIDVCTLTKWICSHSFFSSFKCHEKLFKEVLMKCICHLWR